MNLLRSETKSTHGKVVSCYGKEGFSSFGAAQRATRRTKANVKMGKLSAYRCVHCRDWHLGRTPK